MIDNWLAATVRRCVSDLGWLPSPTNSSNKSKLLRYLPKPLSMVLPSSACHKMMADSSIMMIIHTQVPSSPLSSRDFLVMSKQSFGSSSPFIVLPLSRKEYNYRLRASISGSRLTKFRVNTIHIYGSKKIYYENTFRS